MRRDDGFVCGVCKAKERGRPEKRCERCAQPAPFERHHKFGKQISDEIEVLCINCHRIADVFARKTMSRSDFEAVLGAAYKRNNVLENWGVVDDELKQSDFTPTARIKLKTATVEYLMGRSKGSPRFILLSETVRATLETITNAVVASESLLPAMSLIRDVLPQSILSGFDKFQIKAALLTEAYEAIHG
jgi:hypothetical protein